jgi:NAD(P)-dependent dehydrogenase (short-subunit alcohol dehydrogenase family)
MRKIMNILITGGNRGLGFELVKVFLSNGNDVLSIVRSEQARHAIEKDFPQCSVVVTDITNYSKLKELDYFKKNKIDIVINNAGGGGQGTSVTDTDADEIEKQFMVHCLAAFNVIKAAYSLLVKSDNPVIVNISSRVGSISKNVLGEFANKGFSYSDRIAKGAQNMLTQCLSQELGPKGFKVCALHPGRLLTLSGASDAHMAPYESAQITYRMLIEDEIENGGYYCVETGTIPW